MPVEDLAIRFDRGSIEQARKLGAAHTPEHGWTTLIVGRTSPIRSPATGSPRLSLA